MQVQTIGGRYQILTQMGQGQYGTTFLAQDMQSPGNPQCIVKHFKPLSTNTYNFEEAKHWFDKEALILETLAKHDQIPQLLAYFAENQQFYLVQEFIRGHDIAEEIPPLGRRLNEPETIKLLKDILEILAFVHQQNLVHHNLKPSNIRRRHLDNKIVLIDFVILKYATQMANFQGQTSLNLAVDTYSNVPSEEATYIPQFSSDVYAVGMIGIQALTGINLANSSAQELLINPDTRKIDWHNQIQVSQELKEILDAMILNDSCQRYPTATSVLQALEMLDKTPDTAIQRTIQFVRPQKFFASAAITAVVATISLWLLQLQTNTRNFLTYQDSIHGIQIQYPKNWRIEETPNLITKQFLIFSSPQESEQDNFQELLTINIENFSGTLKEAKDVFIKQVKATLSDATILDTSEATLAKKPANKLIFIGKNGQKSLKSLQILTLKGDRAYIITYSATIDDFDRFLPTAEKMIESFEIN
ncbi:MAG: protein kinase [Nostoc sp. ChiSLP02]|nr:protein kinase [Nostoc sp. DedSLP05]MDZ8097848.1 protein kinase [Nostoc sp. DedSLP01]MDZ8183933.1 protein kinase [Nostoc sp. ChiSLP02]